MYVIISPDAPLTSIEQIGRTAPTTASGLVAPTATVGVPPAWSMPQSAGAASNAAGVGQVSCEEKNDNPGSVAICYAGLWYVGGNQFTEGDTSSETVDYSILAIAVSMYLLLSIAVADLCGGSALVVEGRGSGDDFVWFTGRRLFGVFLVVTFLTLIGASVRVLFFSSQDNVTLVIGAAAVLFIADVDEKAHTVLKNFSGKSRLCWVLEIIGMSFVLATFSLKATDNYGRVAGKDAYKSDCAGWGNDCGIFTWQYIFFELPLTVTVSRPTLAMEHVLLLALCWVSMPYFFRWIILLAVAIVLFVVVVAVVIARRSFRELYRAFTQGAERFTATDKRRRFYLFWAGIVVQLLRVALTAMYFSLSDNDQLVFSESIFSAEDAISFLDALVHLAIFSWWICGMGISEGPSRDIAIDPPLQPMLLGWGLYYGVLIVLTLVFEWIRGPSDFADAMVYIAEWSVRHCWNIMIGTWVWRAEGKKDVAYWIAASGLVFTMGLCVAAWVDAWKESVLT
ncbi:unnamed protein product [Ectocarpus sp. CCAP 1310/34]|nr:unnamed protein product [Ectocarpus sp. CCAP 1310/34]